MNLDIKILSELEKSQYGLSTLAVSRNCKINRLTAKRHLAKLVESGEVIRQAIHQKLFIFLPTKKSHGRD
jgi:response regulator of citrate/malate metabolism